MIYYNVYKYLHKSQDGERRNNDRYTSANGE